MKRPLQKKLYNKLVGLTLPEHIQRFGGGGQNTYRIDHLKLVGAAFMRWPSGKPCDAVNMYLLDESHKWTGDTVLTVAAKLSELVRYCAKHGRRFGDLNDGDMAVLIEKLCTDCYLDDSTQRLRNNNSVRAIIQACLIFLDWYQKKLYLGSVKLLGERAEGAAIIAERRGNQRSHHSYWHHRYLPPVTSTDPKLPMGTSMIEDIEKVIEDLYYPAAYSEPAQRRFGQNQALFDGYRDYITARREFMMFMMFMMRRTGLRPEELTQMPLEKNRHSLNGKQPCLTLPTMKRRKLEPPPRQFPLTEKDSIRVKIYLESRKDWLACCRLRNTELVEPNVMFLSTEPGNLCGAVKKSGLVKDFENLCNRAGFRDHQSCFSMFRHRFITDLVLLHLKEWQLQNSELAKRDYRSLLEKVREKTGHRSIESLWHYIDLAQEMGGVWDPVNKAVRRLEASEELKYELVQLRRDMLRGEPDKMTSAQVIDIVIARLKQITGDAERAGINPTNIGKERNLG